MECAEKEEAWGTAESQLQPGLPVERGEGVEEDGVQVYNTIQRTIQYRVRDSVNRCDWFQDEVGWDYGICGGNYRFDHCGGLSDNVFAPCKQYDSADG